MKKTYERPDLYCEEFNLSEHVAKGCGAKTEIVPGSSVTVDFVACEQLIKADGSLGHGQGHWVGKDLVIEDTNKNGIIDWSEFVAATGSAQNGVITGSGHEGHNLQMKVPGQEITEIVPLNS